MSPLKGGFEAADDRLGRLPSFDERSRDYNVAERLRTVAPRRALPAPRSYTWPNRYITDQIRGTCVAHAHKGRIANPPISTRGLTDQQLTDQAQRIFPAYQRADEWPGEYPAYDGTSVIAGAQVETKAGNYASYWWGFDVDTILLGIGYVAPAVFGVPWLESMFEPRPSGLLEVHGNFAGGHAIRGRGVLLRAHLRGEGSKPIAVVRWSNSWGRSWGVGGDCLIRVDDLERLLKMEGECCFPVEPRQRRAQV